MGLVFINEDNLTATADAIREKTGGTLPYKPAEFAKHIRAIRQDYTLPSKGIIIYKNDEDGFAIEAAIVGLEDLPPYYMYNAAIKSSDTNCGWLSRVGDNLSLQDTIKSIGSYCFYYCQGIKKLKLPEELESLNEGCFYQSTYLEIDKLPNTLKTLGKSAFYNCSKITISEIPENVESIGENAFYGCTSIPSMNIKTNLITSLPSTCFYGCGKLETVNIPETINTINSSCFYGCSKLKTINLHDNIHTISTSAFRDNSLLELATLPINLKTIGGYAFYNCKNISLKSFPDTLQSIGEYAFYGCSKLEIEEIPEGITAISIYCFQNCSLMPLKRIADSVKSIGQYAFQGCQKLALTYLSKNITAINNYTFYGCTGLTEMTLKGNITSIGSYGFNNCSNLAKLVLPNVTKVPALASSNVFTNTPIAKGTGSIIVPCDLIDSFKSASYWSTYKNIITGVTLESLNITNNNINLYKGSEELEILYNDATARHEALGDQSGYTISIEGNATLDNNTIILAENAEVGDIITVTVTSTYNPEIYIIKELTVIYKEISVSINLNDGQWVDSGTTINDNIVYKSDAGSYLISNGKSIATLTVKGIQYLKLYIRSYGENSHDYTEAFEIDTPATRSKGKYTTMNKSSSSTYTECVYNLDGETHTIDIMYSKDGSGNSYDDRGYFYIGEYE